MAKKDKILTDVKHWFGWIASTAIVIVVFHFLGVHLHLVWYHPLILLGTIVIVDYAKHKIGLQ